MSGAMVSVIGIFSMLAVVLIARMLHEQVSQLRDRVEELERSTTDRFAVVMRSNGKIHAEHKALQTRMQRLDAAVKKLSDKKEPTNV